MKIKKTIFGKIITGVVIKTFVLITTCWADTGKSLDSAFLHIGKYNGEGLFSLISKIDDEEVRLTTLLDLQVKIASEWQEIGKWEIVSRQGDRQIYSAPLGKSGKCLELVISQRKEGTWVVKSEQLNKLGVRAVRGNWRLHPVEQLYGFGETWNGQLGQRGKSITIWDKGGTPDECAYMPYWVSTRNYGLYLHYGGKVKTDIGRNDSEKLAFEIFGSSFEVTLFAAESLAGAVKTFAQLTGLPKAPPRWAYKPWFWQMSTPDNPTGPIDDLKAQHVLDMVNRLKVMDIPVGVTWFEPPWQTNRTSFLPDTAFSSNLHDIVDSLKRLDVKVLAWTVPYTTKGAENWSEAIQKNYLVRKPHAKVDQEDNVIISKSGELEGTYYNSIDYFNPEAAAWWKKQLDQAIDLGISGFKLDAGQEIPEDAILHGSLQGKDVHNSYATEYNRVFDEQLQKRLPGDFLNVSRAAWVGSAPYIVFKWPGDLSGDFGNNGLSSSVYSSLSLALSGLPFVSTDIGGFENRPPDERVFIRWAQFGAFLPGMQTLNMPWWYSSSTQQHFRYLAWLHTALTPYWVTLANQAAKDGTPICRPLVWEYQEDQETWYVDDEFTVGGNLLVAPIINGDYGREVYLPSDEWVDFWNPEERIKGPATIRWHKGWSEEALRQFPLYVKAGSIIPMELNGALNGLGFDELKGYTTMTIWPKEHGSTSITVDDRPSIVVETKAEPSHLYLVWSESNVEKLMFRIQLHPDSMIRAIQLDGKTIAPVFKQADLVTQDKASWFFEKDRGVLWVQPARSNNATTGKISLQFSSSI